MPARAPAAIQQLPELLIASRAIGAPTSAVCPLHGAISNQHRLHAFGTADGHVVVQSLQSGSDVPVTLAVADVFVSSISEGSSNSKGGSGSDGCGDQSSSISRQAVRLVAWDGNHLLAVAAGTQLHILSFDGLFARMQQSSACDVRLSGCPQAVVNTLCTEVQHPGCSKRDASGLSMHGLGSQSAYIPALACRSWKYVESYF